MVAAYEVELNIEAAVATSPIVQISDLETRLARGYDMIEQHRAAGFSVTRLEEHWLSLLSDYETLFDTIDNHGH